MRQVWRYKQEQRTTSPAIQLLNNGDDDVPVFVIYIKIPSISHISPTWKAPDHALRFLFNSSRSSFSTSAVAGIGTEQNT